MTIFMNGLHKCFRYWIKKDIQAIGLNIYLSGWIEKYFCDSIEYEVMVIEFNTSFVIGLNEYLVMVKLNRQT